MRYSLLYDISFEKKNKIPITITIKTIGNFAIYLALILPYIHNPTPTIIAKMIIPTIKDATTFMRNAAIAIITINASIPIIIYPIVPAKPK